MKSEQKRNRVAVIEFALITAVSWLLLAACGVMDKQLVKQGGSGSQSAGFPVFKARVHPFILSKCAGCHGSTQIPLFGVSDAAKAYIETKNHIGDFKNPVTSHWATAASDSHCGNGSLCGAANAAVLQPLLGDWAKAELAPPIK